LNILKKTALHFARKKYCRAAILECADLLAIKKKPEPHVIIGLSLIAFSYVIGLPAVIAMGVIAVWTKEPKIGIIGGPVIYLISTIIFIIGIKMAGKKYFHLFSRWVIRIVLEKILGEDVRLISKADSDNEC